MAGGPGKCRSRQFAGCAAATAALNSAQQGLRWNDNAKHRCRFEIQHELELCGAVDRGFGRVGSPQNSGDHDASVAEIAEKIGPIAHQSSVARKVELVDVVRLPPTAKKELARYAESRARAQAEVQALRRATRNVVSTLTSKFGISLRDASALLGLSRERVRQLTV